MSDGPLSFLVSGVPKPVSDVNPLPITGGGGGGGGGASLADSLLMDSNGVLFICRDDGTSLTYVNVSNGSAYTPVGTITVASAAGAATSAKQDTANTSLGSLVTGMASLGTAARQDTGNTSLATIATAAGTQATAAKQDTGNTSLATIATNSANPALETGGNLASLSTNLGAQADSAAASDSATASLIAFMKRLVAKLPNIGKQVSTAAMAVVLASDQVALAVNADPAMIIAPPAAVTLAAAAQTVVWQVEGGGSFYISLTNAPAATAQPVATVQFEYSTDNSAWSALSVLPLSSPTAAAVTSSTTVGLWLANTSNAPTMYVRARCSAWTSGTFYVDLESIAVPSGAITMPWNYTVTSAQTVVPAFDTAGISDVTLQISAITTTVLTVQGTNDPSLTTWDTIPNYNVLGTTPSGSTISAAGSYRFSTAGFKYARVQCTTTGTVLTIQGAMARLGMPWQFSTASNLAQIGGAAVAAASAQLGVNVVNLGGTAAAASIANGSTNKALGVTVASAVSQVDQSATAFAGAGRVNGTVVASAQGGGAVVASEINISALTLGTATSVVPILQESTGGTNFTDIWVGDAVTTTGIQRCPAIPVAGRRRWCIHSVGGTSTTVTVTITTLELPTGSYPLLRQFRDVYSATNPLASVFNSATAVATTLVQTTLNSLSAPWYVEGLKQITAFATFVGGTPTTAPIITVMLSMDGTNWFASGSTFTPTAAGVFGVTLNTNAWKFAQLKVTTASSGGTPYTLGAVGINGVN